MAQVPSMAVKSREPLCEKTASLVCVLKLYSAMSCRSTTLSN